MRLAAGFKPILPAMDLAKVATKAEKVGYDSIFVHESLYQRGFSPTSPARQT